MAYIIRIERQCKAQGCGRRASHELFDDAGRSRGVYCRDDAQHELKRLEVRR